MNIRLIVCVLSGALAACSNQEVPLPEQTAAATEKAAQENASGVLQLTPEELGAPALPAVTSCNIESIEGTASGSVPIIVSQETSVDGWFVSEVSNRPGTPAKLRISAADDSAGWQQEISSWISRPDVSEAKGIEDSAKLGFTQVLDLRAVPPGNYRLTVVFVENGQLYECDKGSSIVVP